MWQEILKFGKFLLCCVIIILYYRIIIYNNMIFMFVYVMFQIWIQIYRKLYFTNLANPKNPNLNLDSTDYGCEICLVLDIYLFIWGFTSLSKHCTGHIMTGSWKGRGNQYIQLIRILYCKLPTNGKQLPAFPYEAVLGIEPRPQRWEATLKIINLSKWCLKRQVS